MLTVATISRSTSNATSDVVVLAETVVASSRKVAINSSISAVDVVDAMVVAIDRTTFNDAVESVCAAIVDMISRKTPRSDTLVEVVAAIAVTSSRNVAVSRVICDNDVVATMVVLNSNVAAPTPR